MAALFDRVEVTPELRRLRADVRGFLAAEDPRHAPGRTPGLGMGAEFSPDFSRRLAARGWMGMAIPSRYGGRDRTALERFVVVEELLAWGAPVGAHWVADRQTAQTILSFGTEEQKQRFLPAIAAGECYFSIGMSEPDAGSDLAGVRTTGTRADGGWLLNGTKIWTSGAHRNHWVLALVRTDPEAEDRHHGLSQMIVDLQAPGLTVNTIPFLDGSADFCEVVFDDVYVPDDLVLGQPGKGWQQVTSELAFERAGPDRYLSTYQLVEQFVRCHPGDAAAEAAREVVGRLAARWWAIRQLSMSVSAAIDRGGAPAVQAALVKELGTRFEQRVLADVQRLVDLQPRLDADDVFERLLARATLVAPSFTIRGGTIEVLRSVASKGLRPSSTAGR